MVVSRLRWSGASLTPRGPGSIPGQSTSYARLVQDNVALDRSPSTSAALPSLYHSSNVPQSLMCTATDNVVKQDNLSHAVISVANGVLRDIWMEIWQQLAMAEFIKCIETVITTHRK